MTIFNSRPASIQFEELYYGLKTESDKAKFGQAIRDAAGKKMYGDEKHEYYTLTQEEVVAVYDKLFPTV